MTKKSGSKLNDNLFLLLTMVLIMIISSLLTFSLSVFIIQLLLGTITILLLAKKDYNNLKIYIIIFFISMCFVFLVYFANLLSYGSPYYIGGSDDLMFERQGLDAYNFNIYSPEELLESRVIPSYHNSSFFVIYVSVLIRLSKLFDGFNTFIPRIVNVYFLLWNTMIIEYFIKKYANFSAKKANISIAVFALTPNIQYINSHVFRDTFNLLQVLLITFLFEKIVSNRKYMRKIFYLIMLLFLVYITFYTRKNSLVFAGAISILMLGKKFKIKKRYIIILLLFIISMTDFMEVIRLESFIKGYSSYVLSKAEDGLSGYIFRQPLLPFGIILRFFYGLIRPFPNFLKLFKSPNEIILDFVMFLIYCGVVIQILFIPFILKRVLKFDWLSLSFLACFLGVIITTFTFRHVILYYPFMVALGIDGYVSSNKIRRKQILFLWMFTASLLGLIYVFIKLLA